MSYYPPGTSNQDLINAGIESDGEFWRLLEEHPEFRLNNLLETGSTGEQCLVSTPYGPDIKLRDKRYDEVICEFSLDDLNAKDKLELAMINGYREGKDISGAASAWCAFVLAGIQKELEKEIK